MKPLILSWVGFNYSSSIIISKIFILNLLFAFLLVPINYLAMAREKFRFLIISAASLPFFYIIIFLLIRNKLDYMALPIAKFTDMNGAFVLPGPRIMFIGGLRSIALWSSSGASIVQIPIISNYSNLAATIGDYDLNFAPESPSQFIVASPYANLYNLYWRRYYEELYSPQSRVMEAYVKLNVSDVATLQFSDKIWIQDSWWRLLEINNYIVGDTQPTLCKFARIVNSAPICSLTPTSRNGNGTINWVNAADEPTDGNQTCCELFGYSWNSTTNECYAFPQNIVRI
jgi:hypothetical protein